MTVDVVALADQVRDFSVHGYEQVEIYLRASTSRTSIMIDGTTTERMHTSSAAAARVIVNGRMGHASDSRATPATIQALVEQARANAVWSQRAHRRLPTIQPTAVAAPQQLPRPSSALLTAVGPRIPAFATLSVTETAWTAALVREGGLALADQGRSAAATLVSGPLRVLRRRPDADSDLIEEVLTASARSSAHIDVDLHVAADDELSVLLLSPEACVLLLTQVTSLLTAECAERVRVEAGLAEGWPDHVGLRLVDRPFDGGGFRDAEGQVLHELRLVENGGVVDLLRDSAGGTAPTNGRAAREDALEAPTPAAQEQYFTTCTGFAETLAARPGAIAVKSVLAVQQGRGRYSPVIRAVLHLAQPGRALQLLCPAATLLAGILAVSEPSARLRPAGLLGQHVLLELPSRHLKPVGG